MNETDRVRTNRDRFEVGFAAPNEPANQANRRNLGSEPRLQTFRGIRPLTTLQAPLKTGQPATDVARDQAHDYRSPHGCSQSPR